jgi:hypothetical protein
MMTEQAGRRRLTLATAASPGGPIPASSFRQLSTMAAATDQSDWSDSASGGRRAVPGSKVRVVF